jgi:MGT family glycosyltransferase
MRVAVFSMLEAGHLQRLRPLIRGLAERGIEVDVYTHTQFREPVEAAGGTFIDLFERYPIDSADSESSLVPCRYVSFAAAYVDQIARDLQDREVALVVYATFAVVARVAARKLGIPYVNVCTGHNVHPAEFVPIMKAQFADGVGEACRRAVEVLRERHGVVDASPFSWLEGLSPFLNVYCEPPNFLTDSERAGFEPIAFYGSLLASDGLEPTDGTRGSSAPGDADSPQIYISFGTLIWRYFTEPALAALGSLAEALGSLPKVRGLISLGGVRQEPATVDALERENVRVAHYVDQWRVLGEADAYVTHHGLNSTHEAIFHMVPMVSYPFFADQPALAARCQELGIALPLHAELLGEVRPADAKDAIETALARREEMRKRLEEARGWELETIARRPEVLDRIVALAEAD